MAKLSKQIIDDQIWSERLDEAESYYKHWEELFDCDLLDSYYEGRQWEDSEEYKPYTINKFLETIQIKIANYVPTFPKFLVSSKPAFEADLEAASTSAHLKGDLLNTISDDNKLHFSDEMEQAYKDSFFRFGIIEVGYEADWIHNPNAPRPLLGKDALKNPSFSERRKILEEPPELPQNERVYVRHIPAKTFRIGGFDHKYLSRCGWCGYFDFVDKDELLALPKLLNRDKISNWAGGSTEADRSSHDGIGDKWRRKGIKIWRLWDLRAQIRVVVTADPTVTIFQRRFNRLPLFDFRPDKRLIVAGFYPIPPAFHWISPQIEYNETREMLRAHRRRFLRKFQVVGEYIDQIELEKFESGQDGSLIKVRRENAITPIQSADLGKAVEETAQIAADDLNRISGTSDESRGVADRTTATQATIVNQRTALRENKERDRVVKWFCEIGREIILIVRDNFTEKTIVRLTDPEGEVFGGSISESVKTFKAIRAEDLKDGYDFKIDVDLTSMSVAAAEDEKKKLYEFTAFLQQNPFVAFSPYLIREAAVRIGFRNEKAIKEFQQMALLMEMARMNQLQMAAGMTPGGQPAQMMQQATPPAQQQIAQQISNQQQANTGAQSV